MIFTEMSMIILEGKAIVINDTSDDEFNLKIINYQGGLPIFEQSLNRKQLEELLNMLTKFLNITRIN